MRLPYDPEDGLASTGELPTPLSTEFRPASVDVRVAYRAACGSGDRNAVVEGPLVPAETRFHPPIH